MTSHGLKQHLQHCLTSLNMSHHHYFTRWFKNKQKKIIIILWSGMLLKKCIFAYVNYKIFRSYSYSIERDFEKLNLPALRPLYSHILQLIRFNVLCSEDKYTSIQINTFTYFFNQILLKLQPLLLRACQRNCKPSTSYY